MLQVQSPQFSNSSKINLSNFISPTRNKRIVSAQPCCSSLQSNRNNSYKKLDSPSKINEHKRKKSQGGGHIKTKSKDLVIQVNTLKEQYTALKTAYKELVAEKLRQTQKENILQTANQKLTVENQRLVRDNENLKGKVNFLQGQIQRIKRESIKLVETWQFKMNAVEQKLSQKQKHLSQIRQYLQQNSIPEPRSSKQRQSKNDKIFTSSLAILSDSLSMTYHNIDPLSNTSQYLSISMNQCHDRDRQRKDKQVMVQTVCHKVLQVSADVGSGLKESDQNRKMEQNFKKIRKQLSKKIEVNIDDKHKDFINQIQPKTPMDRKNQNKTSKVPKIKLKKEEDYIESKSSKKKMSAR